MPGPRAPVVVPGLCAGLVGLVACGLGPGGATPSNPMGSPDRREVVAAPPTLPPLTGPTAGPPAVAALEATLRSGLLATRTPIPSRWLEAPLLARGWEVGIDGIDARPLDGAAGYWLVSSRGARVPGAQRHFVAVYSFDGGWRAVGKVELDCPDRLDGVAPAPELPGRHWIIARGRAGAHDRCFDLIGFDAGGVEHVIEQRTPGPDGHALRDVNGDGVVEVVLDASNPYVLCYACGVMDVGYDVRRWIAGAWEPVALAPLRSTDAGSVAGQVDRAVTLARAGLWKDAATRVRRLSAAAMDPAVAWNAALIDLNAAGRARHAATSRHPLLPHVLYGDYAAAIAPMRRIGVARLFGPRPPGVADTPAEAWGGRLAVWVERATTAAVNVDPALAPAFFLRGWARHLANPANRDAIRDVAHAAALAPGDELYRESAAYLEAERRFLDALQTAEPDA